MAGKKETCELCGKSKKVDKMVQYYFPKRTDTHRIMYKCKNCAEAED